jgi:hypothetical protein
MYTGTYPIISGLILVAQNSNIDIVQKLCARIHVSGVVSK